jgi:hypothetical protein
MNEKLLQELLLAVEANERRQRRFRTAVLMRLARIETTVTMILGGHLVKSSPPRESEEEQTKRITDFEEFIAGRSDEIGLKLVAFTHGEPKAIGARRTKRRKSE